MLNEDLTGVNKSVNRGFNKEKKPPNDDRFHLALLFLVLALTYWINRGFGFEIGTGINGIITTIGVLIWLVVTLVDYYNNRS